MDAPTFAPVVTAFVTGSAEALTRNRAERRIGKRPAPTFTLATCPTCRRPFAECVCHWTHR